MDLENKNKWALYLLLIALGMAIQFAFDMGFIIRPVFHEAYQLGYNASLLDAKIPVLIDCFNYSVMP